MGYDTRQGQVSGRVAEKWDAVAIAVDTNWFTDDIVPFIPARKDFALEDGATVVKHTLEIVVPADTVVNIQKKFNIITKTVTLNGGDVLLADVGYQFDLMLQKGMTYNIQHKAGNQIVAVIITESYNTDI